MDAITQKTPCGRIPNTALRNPRHEALAHAFVQGKTGRDAGLDAGYKDGPGLKGNVARLRTHDAELRERIAELAQHSADLAEIYDGWLLADVKLFAKANLSSFFKRDAEGRLVVVETTRGSLVPVLDFSNATEEQLRVIQKIKHTKFGPEIEIRDPVNALDKLMRHRGLLAPGDVSATLKVIVQGGLPEEMPRTPAA